MRSEIQSNQSGMSNRGSSVVRTMSLPRGANLGRLSGWPQTRSLGFVRNSRIVAVGFRGMARRVLLAVHRQPAQRMTRSTSIPATLPTTFRNLRPLSRGQLIRPVTNCHRIDGGLAGHRMIVKEGLVIR
jgi:hypothetical protein